MRPPVVYARPHDCSDHRSEPTSTADYGCITSAHCRASWVPDTASRSKRSSGAPLPPPNEELPEEIEVQLSRLISEAGASSLRSGIKQEAAQKQAQQKQQDPVIQLATSRAAGQSSKTYSVRLRKTRWMRRLKQAELQRKMHRKTKLMLSVDAAATRIRKTRVGTRRSESWR